VEVPVAITRIRSHHPHPLRRPDIPSQAVSDHQDLGGVPVDPLQGIPEYLRVRLVRPGQVGGDDLVEDGIEPGPLQAGDGVFEVGVGHDRERETTVLQGLQRRLDARVGCEVADLPLLVRLAAPGIPLVGVDAVVGHEVPDIVPVLESPPVPPEEVAEEVHGPVQAEDPVDLAAGRDLCLDEVEERVVHVEEDGGDGPGCGWYDHGLGVCLSGV